MTGTMAIRARWALISADGGRRIETDRWIVVEGTRIAAIADARPAGADTVIDRPDALVVPGLMNMHNHGISALLFRGIVEDRATASWASDTVYGLIMPLQGLAMEVLDADELRAVTALGFLAPLKSGGDHGDGRLPARPGGKLRDRRGDGAAALRHALSLFDRRHGHRCGRQAGLCRASGGRRRSRPLPCAVRCP